jgi:hypothetical protein
VSADLTRVAAIVAPHVEGTFKRDERINGTVQELADHGLLAGVAPRSHPCRPSWRSRTCSSAA